MNTIYYFNLKLKDDRKFGEGWSFSYRNKVMIVTKQWVRIAATSFLTLLPDIDEDQIDVIERWHIMEDPDVIAEFLAGETFKP